VPVSPGLVYPLTDSGMASFIGRTIMIRYLLILALLVWLTMSIPPASAAGPEAELQSFIHTVVGEQDYTYWVVNDHAVLGKESVVDVSIHFKNTQARFIVGFVNGHIVGVQNIDVEDEVNCAEKLKEGET